MTFGEINKAVKENDMILVRTEMTQIMKNCPELKLHILCYKENAHNLGDMTKKIIESISENIKIKLDVEIK